MVLSLRVLSHSGVIPETALHSDSEGEEEGFDLLRVARVAFVYRIPRFRNSKFRLLKLSHGG